MGTEALDAQLLTVGELFADSEAIYTVPVYQRNYAWRAEQIEQLLNDIQDAMVDGEGGYFLGNLIVTERDSTSLDFEVIDGQQRLTTLYLLLILLANDGTVQDQTHTHRLRYQSRPRAAEALRRIAAESSLHAETASELLSNEDAAIHQGFNVIRQFMDQHIQGADRRRFAEFLSRRVTLVRASLPNDTDLNRYFEVMNTRGQQLQQVDIVKARLMSFLEDSERACFAWIWDACADMDSYVQMSLTRGSTDLRRRVFGDDWSWLTASSFQQLHETQAIVEPADAGPTASKVASLTLDEALSTYSALGHSTPSDDPDNVRFRSTIEFPAFLLQVLRVMRSAPEEVEGELDDKRLINRFDEEFARDDGKRVREFAFELLRCRNLFDSYILKRQFTATNGEDGDWSLQRLTRRASKGKETPGYLNTFSGGNTQVEEDGDVDATTGSLLVIQSMLRVTYTSPRSMNWISKILKLLVETGPREVSGPVLVEALRDYARQKVKESFFDTPQPAGFGIGRIVFTYLDYLLVAAQPKSDFRFTYRNSIEHFYPQHPDEHQSGSAVSDRYLHLLGNLALVSVGANSKFSNSLPKAKAENFRSTIEKQSPKLHLMASIARHEAWSDQQVQTHHNRMIDLLREDIGLQSR